MYCDDIVTVRDLSKKYGHKTVLRGLNLHLKQGEVVLLLGQNGAGKTTTVNCILGQTSYNGQITIMGNRPNSIDAKRLSGYVPEIPIPYDFLSVWEHFEFVMHAHKVSTRKEYAEKLLYRFQLDSVRNKLGKSLSKGMKQKLNICCALIPNPQILIFDEPFVGLDPLAIAELKEVIRELKFIGCSILISTHMIDMVDEIWDRAYIISDGELVSELAKTDISSLEKTYLSILDNKE